MFVNLPMPFSSVSWIAALLLAWVVPTQAWAFSLDDVAARAKAIAAEPYKQPDIRMPQELRDLDYDQYRDIRFKPEQALWRDEKLPFEVMFFHQGRTLAEPIRINVVEPHGVSEVPFDPALFDYGKNRLDMHKMLEAGFNGFRIHYAINKPAYKDEVLVFQGASYFRALGKGQHYGLSARGLAVDTAEPGGEEFPRFVEFWIEKPRAKATSLVIYAMLDSKRIAGAYRFVVTPGAETDIQVTARPVCARQGRQGGNGAIDQHVCVRREPARPRRLPARGARLGRPVDRGWQRRMDLAPAGQPEASSRHVVRRQRLEGFRADAARPLAFEL